MRKTFLPLFFACGLTMAAEQDSVSRFFSSYINAINAISGNMQRQLTDIAGTEVQAVVVEHAGQKIGYQYQLWIIKDASVCQNAKSNTAHFSQCTLAAKSLFEQTCQYLQEHPDAGWRYLKLKNMYCRAAVSFQPTIASVAWSQTEETELDRAKKECSLLTVAALGNPDTEAVKKRDMACRKYVELRPK
jgi:hypothetical protein